MDRNTLNKITDEIKRRLPIALRPPHIYILLSNRERHDNLYMEQPKRRRESAYVYRTLLVLSLNIKPGQRVTTMLCIYTEQPRV